jgi:hypothetical protein
MSQVLRRALPFVVTFVLGVAVSAIIGSVLPTHRKAFSDDGRPRCKWKARTQVAPGGFVPMERGSTEIDITEIQESGLTSHIPFTLSNSYSTKLTLKEQALLFRAMQEGARSSPGFVVSYGSPEAIDGRPVTSDAVLFNIPRPRFWGDEQIRGRMLDCNAVMRVDLDSSGSVTKVMKAGGYADACPNLSDIFEAASQVTFLPAQRNGVPVSQRISIMYRLL